MRDIGSILSNCDVDPTSGCMLWRGSIIPYGYGAVKINGRQRVVHRAVYELLNGEAPSSMVVMHKCDTPSCCNPDHLVLGTRSENNLDCVRKGRHANASKTHCKRGHEFTAENTVTTSSGRACLTCRKTVYNKKKRGPVRADFKTHCKRGHERTPENTYTEKTGVRKCRICTRERLNKRRRQVMAGGIRNASYRAPGGPDAKDSES